MERSVVADQRLRPSLRPVTDKAIYKDKGRIYIDCEVAGEELKDLKFIKLPYFQNQSATIHSLFMDSNP